MSRIRIKFCGLTTADDVACAARLGADAIGLVFYPPSARAVTPDTANRITDAIPSFITVTALFLNATRGAIENTLAAVPIDLLQFHGDEPPAFCESFGKPYIKALPMADRIDIKKAARRYAGARGLLLDSHSRGDAGGQGKTFDWQALDVEQPIILAGGLAPNNVQEAITVVKPWAVDVSSGVEGRPGKKDHQRMAAFVNEVNNASG